MENHIHLSNQKPSITKEVGAQESRHCLQISGRDQYSPATADQRQSYDGIQKEN